MRKTTILPLLLITIFSFFAACNSSGTKEKPSPKLMVVISVDGLRADLLTRYNEAFTAGFNRLVEDGLYYPRGLQDHGITVTAAGHATIGTGVFPSRHGIITNFWRYFDGDSLRSTLAIGDTTVNIVGFPDAYGASPVHLQMPGLADWLLDSDPESRVVSVSGKDRAAILMAAKAKGHVYWVNDDFGGFSTSTYYRDSLPQWVNDFNSGIVEDYFQPVWDCSVPEEFRFLSRPDSATYEGEYNTFPYDAEEIIADRDLNDPSVAVGWMENQPLVDKLVLEFAKEAVGALDLGTSGSIDFLAVGLSATDRIGHRFGPLSLEQFDNLYRLDKELGAFMDFLDQKVGPDNYVISFSADHGFANQPEYELEGGPGYRVGEEDIQVLRQQIGQMFATLEPDSLTGAVEKFLEDLEYIDRVYTIGELKGISQPDSIDDLMLRSHFENRYTTELAQAGIAHIVNSPRALFGRGTGHGTPWHYDRNVPIIFYGAGITAEASEHKARTVDMAPTLAEIFGIPVPEGLDGRSLLTSEE